MVVLITVFIAAMESKLEQRDIYLRTRSVGCAQEPVFLGDWIGQSYASWKGWHSDSGMLRAKSPRMQSEGTIHRTRSEKGIQQDGVADGNSLYGLSVPSPVEMSDHFPKPSKCHFVQKGWGFQFLPLLMSTCYSLPLSFVITVGMEKYLTVVLISLVPLMTRELCFIIGCA